MEIQETIIAVGDVSTSDAWPVSWSAVVIGALAALAAITIFGLYGTALGLGSIAGIQDFSTWHEVTLLDLMGVIFGGFFAYVIGGWVAGKITGERTAEPAILHAAIAWLLTIPLLLVFLAIGAGKAFGGWYGGIASAMGSPVASVAMQSPLAVRHTAIAAATSLLLGLVGSVIGGWMSCGEPMSLTHYKTRSAAQRRVR